MLGNKRVSHFAFLAKRWPFMMSRSLVIRGNSRFSWRYSTTLPVSPNTAFPIIASCPQNWGRRRPEIYGLSSPCPWEGSLEGLATVEIVSEGRRYRSDSVSCADLFGSYSDGRRRHRTIGKLEFNTTHCVDGRRSLSIKNAIKIGYIRGSIPIYDNPCITCA